MNYKVKHLSKKVGEKEIKSFEELAGYPLPDDYRLFLEQHNHCQVFPCTFEANSLIHEEKLILDLEELFGLNLKRGVLHASLKFNLETLSGRIPSGLIPIGCVTGGLLLLGVSAKYFNQVLFWDREFEFYDEYDSGTVDEHLSNLYLVSSTFNDFLNRLYEFEDDEESIC